MRVNINLSSQLNTDSVKQTVYTYGDPSAPHLINTGISCRGGLANIYQTRGVFNEGYQGTGYITEGGDIIEIRESKDANLRESVNEIYINGVFFDTVIKYGITHQAHIKNVSDVMIGDGIYYTAALGGLNLVVKQFDLLSGAEIGTWEKEILSPNYIPTQPMSIKFNRTATVVDDYWDGYLQSISGDLYYFDKINATVIECQIRMLNKLKYVYSLGDGGNTIYLVFENKNKHDRMLIKYSWTGSRGNITKEAEYRYCGIYAMHSRHNQIGRLWITNKASENKDIVQYLGSQISGPLIYNYPVKYDGVRSVSNITHEVATLTAATASGRINESDSTIQTDSRTGYFALWISPNNYACGAWAKLNNLYPDENYNDANRTPFELRVGIAPTGEWLFVSAAFVGSRDVVYSIEVSSPVGSMISNYGDISQSYIPMVYNGETVCYQNQSGNFTIIKIGQLSNQKIKKISPNLYAINTVSAYPIINTDTMKRELGAVDYVGQFYTGVTLSPPGINYKKAAIKIKSQTSNSIDFGEVVITGSQKVNFIAPTPKIDQLCENLDNERFLVYADGEIIDDSGTPYQTYVEDLTFPVCLNNSFSGRLSTSDENTYLLDENTILSKIGNTLHKKYGGFALFGQNYLYDDSYIYIINIDQSGFVAGGKPEKTADKLGLKYICGTPTEAVFLSDFDNSLFIFDGGRVLRKNKIFIEEEKILKGVNSSGQNLLVLDTETAWILIRDGVVSKLEKKAPPFESQLGAALITTKKGLFAVKDGIYWMFSLAPVNSFSGALPLEWQSAFFGFKQNSKAQLLNYVVRFYNPDRRAMTINTVVYSFDQSSQYESASAIDYLPDMYDKANYGTIRILPANLKALAHSLYIKFAFYVVLYEVVAEFEGDVKAVIPADRSI